jgi:hypothetical protein
LGSRRTWQAPDSGSRRTRGAAARGRRRPPRSGAFDRDGAHHVGSAGDRPPSRSCAPWRRGDRPSTRVMHVAARWTQRLEDVRQGFPSCVLATVRALVRGVNMIAAPESLDGGPLRSSHDLGADRARWYGREWLARAGKGSARRGGVWVITARRVTQELPLSRRGVLAVPEGDGQPCPDLLGAAASMAGHAAIVYLRAAARHSSNLLERGDSRLKAWVSTLKEI